MTVNLYLDGDKRKKEQGKTVFQKVLVDAHDAQRRERKRMSQEEIFDENALRHYLSDQIRSPFSSREDSTATCATSRVASKRRVLFSPRSARRRSSRDFAERHRSAAEALEQGSTTGKS